MDPQAARCGHLPMLKVLREKQSTVVLQMNCNLSALNNQSLPWSLLLVRACLLRLRHFASAMFERILMRTLNQELLHWKL